MKFSLEITMKTDLSVLPKVKDVYITMLPGNDFREVANKAKELVQSGFNPVPHFPARSIKNLNNLRDYVSMCKDFGVKQALVIGGSAEPIGDYHCSLQILETGLFDGFNKSKALLAFDLRKLIEFFAPTIFANFIRLLIFRGPVIPT